MRSIDYIEEWVEELLIRTGVMEEWAVYLRLLILLLVLLLISGISFFITKRLIIGYIYTFIRKSRMKWDDILAEHHVFNNVAHIIPALFVRIMAPTIFGDFETVLPFVIKLTDAYLILVGTTIVVSILKVGELTLSRIPSFQDKPLTSYFQLIRIVLYIAVGILILSILLGKSPLYFLSAFGAMTAILLLIFKDTILGLVASVQMSSNDMIRVGDWVEMHKFNADGDVIAINLNTVKIQNFDKTITSIPTYFFITDSFRNWRGMVQSGGRRIKRSVFLDAHTINFIDPETREKYKKYHLISQYILERQAEIESFNKSHSFDTDQLINGRRMTNIGLFRKYIELYLRSHPAIRNDMTIMVRQLATEDRGIPLEVYCFTNTTVWLEYENIQGDIFDHLFSAANSFNLEIFQQPSGKDVSNALLGLNAKNQGVE